MKYAIVESKMLDKTSDGPRHHVEVLPAGDDKVYVHFGHNAVPQPLWEAAKADRGGRAAKLLASGDLAERGVSGSDDAAPAKE